MERPDFLLPLAELVRKEFEGAAQRTVEPDRTWRIPTSPIAKLRAARPEARGCYGCSRTENELHAVGHGRGCYFDDDLK